MKKAALVLTRIDTYSGCRFAFPNASAKTISHRLQDPLSTFTVSYTASLLTKEIISQKMKYGNGFMLMGFMALNLFPIISKELAQLGRI